MSTTEPLGLADFPLLAVGQYVYRQTASSPLLGPLEFNLAEDIARRLNEHHRNYSGDPRAYSQEANMTIKAGRFPW